MREALKRVHWEQMSWWALLVTIVGHPLAITKPLGASPPITITTFAFPQSVFLIVGVALSLLAWAVAWLLQQTEVVAFKHTYTMGLFLALAVASTFWGLDPLLSLLGSSTSALSLTHIITYCAMTFLLIQLLETPARLRTLTWGFLGSATAVAFIALVQQLTGVDIFKLPVEEWMVGRGLSTIGNPDHLGSFLVGPTILAAALWSGEDRPKLRMIAATMFSLLTVAVVGTLTRGAWIAAFLGIAVAACLLWRSASSRSPRTRILIMLATGVACVAVALAAADSVDLTSRFLTPQRQTATTTGSLGQLNAVSSDRINVWRAALASTAQRPLTGTGPAAFVLGWYPNAIDPSSAGGEGGIADDPHSLFMLVLSTLGIPGAVAFSAIMIAALWQGASASHRLTGSGRFAGGTLYYVAWFVAALATQIALSVGAVSTPLVTQVFVALGILLRPTASAARTNSVAQRAGFVTFAAGTAFLLAFAVIPNLRAEIGMASILRNASEDRARRAAQASPWNTDVQKAYFHWRVSRTKAMAGTTGTDLSVEERLLLEELQEAAAGHPREYYYPAVYANVLANASQRTGDARTASAAVAAADSALQLMQASISTRVDKARALSVLGDYAGMASTLDIYWRNELSSPYPGILFAQALAYSGDNAQSDSVFDELERRFPNDASIDAARRQVEDS